MLKLAAWKRYWFILFNDLLMYTTVGGGAGGTGEVKVKHVLWLDMMRVRRGAEGGEGKEQRWTFEVISAVKCVVVACESEEERERWVNALRDAIDGAMREKAERRKELEGGAAYQLSAEVKRGSGGLGAGLCVVDDDEDDEEGAEWEAVTPTPVTPQMEGGRRYTAPASTFTPPAQPLTAKGAQGVQGVPALTRWGSLKDGRESHA